MIGLLLVLAPVVSAGLIAASARLGSLISSLLLAYLAFVTATVGAVLALSPLREVNQGGLVVFETAILLAALALWWVRGRPGLPLTAARAAARGGARPSGDGALPGAVAVVLLGYELLLGLAVPPNNWDSLTYHLVRACGMGRARRRSTGSRTPRPTGSTSSSRLPSRRTCSSSSAGRGGALSTLPQYLAELAILVAVYGSARRLGFEARACACAAFLLATFSLIALESTTAQNDLVAASFPAVAACFLLGSVGLEPALAGVAVGYGLGAKLTTALVLPVLLCLALLRGRRAVLLAAAAALGAFAGDRRVGFRAQ